MENTKKNSRLLFHKSEAEPTRSSPDQQLEQSLVKITVSEQWVISIKNLPDVYQKISLDFRDRFYKKKNADQPIYLLIKNLIIHAMFISWSSEFQ